MSDLAVSCGPTNPPEPSGDPFRPTMRLRYRFYETAVALENSGTGMAVIRALPSGLMRGALVLQQWWASTCYWGRGEWRDIPFECAP